MRWKIILPNLIIMLAVGVGGWLYLGSYYTSFFDDDARETLERDRNLFIAVNQLGAVRFLRTVMARSQSAEVESVFAPITNEEVAELRGGVAEEAEEGEETEEEQGASSATDDELQFVLRRRAHDECQAIRSFFSQEQGGGRTPEIVAITDRNGVVISRDVNPNAEPVGVNLGEQYPSIRRALEGNAVRDIWFYTDFLLDVAIAPIQARGTVVGALFVGYDISNGVAQTDRDLFGADVVYLLQQDNQWRLHSSSIAEGARRQSLVQQISQHQEEIAQAMSQPQQAQILTLDVAGEDHIGLGGSLSSSEMSASAGYLLVKSVEMVRAPASQAVFVLFFALAGVILVVVSGFLLGNHFIKPVEEIEEGVLRIINGDVSHRFEVNSTEFGGLAYRVNQLVAVLTGEEEETEEESRNGNRS
jgi:HAMP domain-containing protein